MSVKEVDRVLARTLLELQVVREDRDQAEQAVKLKDAEIERLKADVTRLHVRIAMLEREHPHKPFLCLRCGTAWETAHERDECEVRHGASTATSARTGLLPL